VLTNYIFTGPAPPHKAKKALSCAAHENTYSLLWDDMLPNFGIENKIKLGI
jgi:protein-disulfide isomerase